LGRYYRWSSGKCAVIRTIAKPQSKGQFGKRSNRNTNNIAVKAGQEFFIRYGKGFWSKESENIIMRKERKKNAKKLAKEASQERREKHLMKLKEGSEEKRGRNNLRPQRAKSISK
jgi:hypothetical protein